MKTAAFGDTFEVPEARLAAERATEQPHRSLRANATYDASCRAPAHGVPVPVEYGKAPEHEFPAAHEDAVAADEWVTGNAAGIGARAPAATSPPHAVIVDPMAGTNLDMASDDGEQGQRAAPQAHDGVVPQRSHQRPGRHGRPSRPRRRDVSDQRAATAGHVTPDDPRR